MKKADVEDLWTKQDVADFFKVDVRTVERMQIPRVPLLMPGRRRPIVRFDPADVRAFKERVSTRPTVKR